MMVTMLLYAVTVNPSHHNNIKVWVTYQVVGKIFVSNEREHPTTHQHCDGRISLLILENRLKYDQSLSTTSPSVSPRPFLLRGLYLNWYDVFKHQCMYGKITHLAINFMAIWMEYRDGKVKIAKQIMSTLILEEFSTNNVHYIVVVEYLKMFHKGAWNVIQNMYFLWLKLM